MDTEYVTDDTSASVSNSQSIPISQSSSTSNSVDEEAKRRKMMSKLWGKGNKLSQKVRELDKSAVNNNSDSSTIADHEDQQKSGGIETHSSHSISLDSKMLTEDNANSIHTSKPYAVVKPIIVMKSGLIISGTTEQSHLLNESSSADSTTESRNMTTTEVQQQVSSLSSVSHSEKASSKKKKSHKHDDAKKKKSRSRSKERDQTSRHNHHEYTDSSNKHLSSKPRRQDRDEEQSSRNRYELKSSHHRSSPITSSQNEDHSDRRSYHSKRNEISSKNPSSPSDKDRQRSNSKARNTTDRTKSFYCRGHHRSSTTRSPSPSRSTRNFPSDVRTSSKVATPPKNELCSNIDKSKPNRSTIELGSSQNLNGATMPAHSHTNDQHYQRHPSVEIINVHQEENFKTKLKEERKIDASQLKKTREKSPGHQHSASKIGSGHDETISIRSRTNKEEIHRRRSRSRSRSQNSHDRSDRKYAQSNYQHESTNHQKSSFEKEAKKSNEIIHREKKSNRTSPVVSGGDRHRRRSSPDNYRHSRRDPSPTYDRRKSHKYGTPSNHSHYPNNHHSYYHANRHHQQHYHDANRSHSSRYHHDSHRHSISPTSRHHQLRYYSTSSSSTSSSPYRRSPTRSSTSSRSSSYSSISSTSSSSRSRSRTDHDFQQAKYRRSPTLEKLFLKASESIESVSTQKNPKQNSTQLIPVRPSNSIDNPSMSPQISSLSTTNMFYSESFSGFSAPPPPFLLQPQQRFLKEITTDAAVSQKPLMNETQIQITPTISSSAVSNIDSGTCSRTSQATDMIINVRPITVKHPRVSRFSDIEPPKSISTVPTIIDIPVDTSLDYTQISENIHCLPMYRRQQKRHNREVMECECTTSEHDRARGIKACGTECLNRMLLIECGPMCPCGQYCTNRRFQRRSYANHKLVLFKTDMKGYGLRTTGFIRKGRFLVEYVGEVIDMDELARRNKKYKREGHIHQYVMSLIHGTVIDSTVKGNWARFINHSCEPNCVAEKWLVNGEYRMGLFARRDLNPGEEITIDYRFENFGTTDLPNEKCYCGAATCRGTISIKNNNNQNNLAKRSTRRQPLDDDELIVYLRDETTYDYIIPKTIEEIRQLIQIMSRTDSENVRLIELDLIRNGSQKQVELARLFLECNGLHVLSSWMKDILIDGDENQDEQQYSNEFKGSLLDFVHHVLPIKDRTTVAKHGLLDLIESRLRLPTILQENIQEDEHKQITDLMNSMLDHLEDPIVNKLFHLYSTWKSLKERFIIPKRKESQSSSEQNNHHYHHHHHHRYGSKHTEEDPYHRYSFSSRSSENHRRSSDRSTSRRSFLSRESHRSYESQLSKDERRRLIEQQFEDEERARAAASNTAVTLGNNESPGTQNEPPLKKQRISDGTESTTTPTPRPLDESSMSHQNQMDQIHFVHQHLSQIPIDYIRSYLSSTGQSESQNVEEKNMKTEPLLPPPPPRPNNENESSSIMRLPHGWIAATCSVDSSVYFYNQETGATSWIPPVPLPSSWIAASTRYAIGTQSAIDLSPLSSAHVSEQHRSHNLQQDSMSLLLSMKLAKQSYRHQRTHRYHHHHHHHHHMMNMNKRKRLTTTDPNSESVSIQENANENSDEQLMDDMKSGTIVDETSTLSTGRTLTDQNGKDHSSILTNVSDTNGGSDEGAVSNTENYHQNTLSSASRINRDMLRRNISQHVHETLKPYTKRTCKQGRIGSTDDIKYLVKKFTLAVLDKEIEKAKNDGVPLSPVLTDRVRLKTEMYVKKYMNKVGPVFQRHDTSVSNASLHSTQPVVQSPPTVVPVPINSE